MRRDEERKDMIRNGTALLTAGLALLLGAAAPAAGEDAIKVGVVDLSQAINATEEGKAAREELNRKRRAAEQQVQPLIDRMKALDEEMKGKKYVMNEQTLFAKQADMLELRNKIDSKIKELEGQLKIDQGRLEAPLIAKLRDIVQEIGKEQGFTMILDRSTPGLVYTREALDITNQVTARFNKKKG
ncbi:MAG TPA: OmpH family outer membrane protein [Myxococcota bacterium]|nr:OmpH family outer membrane protein [Myxococcota bacterium]